MSDIKIYMATHKSVPAPDDPNYVAIQAGAAVCPSLSIMRDDEGDNISARNAYYSELTVQYWIWKNTIVEFVGLTHYRRHFSSRGDGLLHMGKTIASSDELRVQLSTSNFILPEPWIFYHPDSRIPQSIEQHYVHWHGFDIFSARNVLLRIDPQYLAAFDFVMRNNRLSAFNMVVTRKEIFDAYSQWLFGMLFELENVVPLASISGYQARVPAFMAERFFTVWIVHNRHLLHFDYRPIVFYEGV